MSGDWIKMEVCLPDKPEVWQMAGMLGIDADAVVGKLLRVWAWFDSHTVDGNAHSVTYPLLDRIAGVQGFAEAMAIAGWLVQDGSIVRLPNFDRHNGKTGKNRAVSNRRVAEHRKTKRSSNDVVTQDVTPTPLQNPLPEKRREEKKEELKAATVVAMPSADDFRAEMWRRWKALDDGGGGAYLAKLMKSHPEELVLQAVERTLDHEPADPKSFIVACIRTLQKGKQDDDDVFATAI